MGEKKTTLYKYISAKYADSIINKKSLLMSDGSAYNDPFELLVVNNKDHTEQRVPGLRILCLTNSYQKKLMWSHYADSHKGLCLALKVPSEIVYYVCYTGERVYENSDVDKIISKCKDKGKRNLIKPYENLPYAHKIALIKDQKWSYEKEYRIVCAENKIASLKEKDGYFFPVEIERVYLGCRFMDNDPAKREAIIKACKGNKVDIRYMRLSPKNYSVVLEKPNRGKSTDNDTVEEFAAPL